jgi:hypothetical protein
MDSNSNFFVDMEPPRSHFFRRALIFRQSDTNQAGNEGTLHRKMMRRHYKGILAGRAINAVILLAHRQLAARAYRINRKSEPGSGPGQREMFRRAWIGPYAVSAIGGAPAFCRGAGKSQAGSE